MAYRLAWKAEAQEEFERLDRSIKLQALRQLRKLERAPQLGKELGKRLGLDLTGYRKLNFYRGRYRIVYRIDEAANRVMIFGIGPREAGQVYQEVADRLEEEEDAPKI
jgi:mRNA-degrading endonuclease RelE of RelBE toxin-antitoxin system